MVKVVIGNSSVSNSSVTNSSVIDLSLTEISWFKTLENAYQYLTDKTDVIRLPDNLGGCPVTIDQLNDLVSCYRKQIDNNIVDYQRPRSILEHYLEGILDDIDDYANRLIKFILISNKGPLGNKYYGQITGIMYTSEIPINITLYQSIAKSHFNLDQLQYYFNALGHHSDILTTRVIYLRDVEIINQMYKYLTVFDVCQYAVTFGYLDILEYLHQRHCPWDEFVCRNAAEFGHLEILKYAHDNGCPWNESTCSTAALNGHLDCLQYAHINGCEWDEYTCMFAASNGQLNCLKYAHENDCPWNESTPEHAAMYGELGCLKYAHEHGCPWNRTAVDGALNHGHLDCLKYALSHGCPYDINISINAAIYGRLSCLRYLHEFGCPCDNVCESAAKTGHLDCLIYGCEHQLPWGLTCLQAIEYDHFECFKYAYEHGAPCSFREYVWAVESKRHDIIKYLEEHGFYM